MKPNYLPALLLLGGGALVYHLMRRKDAEMASVPSEPSGPTSPDALLKRATAETTPAPAGPSKSVALIGDSIMQGAYSFVKTPKAGKPVQGEPLLKMQKQINTIPADAKTDAMVVSGGINDLAGKASAADIVERAAKLWQNGLSRGWRVAHLELTPAGGGEYEKKISEEERIKANAALELAAKQAGVSFLKMSAFIDPTKPNMLKKDIAAPDKLHLTPDGYKKLGALIDLWLGGQA